MMQSAQLKAIHEKGQSIWYDNLSRDVLQDGSLVRLIEQGVTGLTSNPTIFENAIAKSALYDDRIKALVDGGLSAELICEELFIEDVGAAADLLLPVWESSKGKDGYASLEVSPKLAYDVAGTVEAAKRLWSKLGRSNIMIKIPATEEGIAAIREVLVAGINVNVTLIFSTKRYQEVYRCYLESVKERAKQGLSVVGLSSVASFFVSRLDSLVSEKLSDKGLDPALVEGRISVANCRLAYEIFERLTKEFAPGESGAQVQRPLWASTSTKSERLHPTFYVEKLVAPETVNTMPPATLAACLDGVTPGDLINDMGVSDAEAVVEELEKSGIDLEEVFAELSSQGVSKFADSYQGLLKSVEDKCKVLQS